MLNISDIQQRENYSNLSASMGFIFAARLAGDEPKIIPIKTEHITEIIIAGIEDDMEIVIAIATSGANVFNAIFAI